MRLPATPLHGDLAANSRGALTAWQRLLMRRHRHSTPSGTGRRPPRAWLPCLRRLRRRRRAASRRCSGPTGRQGAGSTRRNGTLPCGRGCCKPVCRRSPCWTRSWLTSTQPTSACAHVAHAACYRASDRSAVAKLTCSLWVRAHHLIKSIQPSAGRTEELVHRLEHQLGHGIQIDPRCWQCRNHGAAELSGWLLAEPTFVADCAGKPLDDRFQLGSACKLPFANVS